MCLCLTAVDTCPARSIQVGHNLSAINIPDPFIAELWLSFILPWIGCLFFIVALIYIQSYTFTSGSGKRAAVKGQHSEALLNVPDKLKLG